MSCLESQHISFLVWKEFNSADYCDVQGQWSVERTNHIIALAALEILGHNSAHSLATGPVIADPIQQENPSSSEKSPQDLNRCTLHWYLPFISPLGLTITPALSSKYMNVPSFLLHGFLWRTTTAGVTTTRHKLHQHHHPAQKAQLWPWDGGVNEQYEQEQTSLDNQCTVCIRANQ